MALCETCRYLKPLGLVSDWKDEPPIFFARLKPSYAALRQSVETYGLCQLSCGGIYLELYSSSCEEHGRYSHDDPVGEGKRSAADTNRGYLVWIL